MGLALAAAGCRSHSEPDPYEVLRKPGHTRPFANDPDPPPVVVSLLGPVRADSEAEVVNLRLGAGLAAQCGLRRPSARFVPSSPQLAPDQGGVIDQVARCLHTVPPGDARIIVIGHAETTRDPELGLRRAEAVAAYLVRVGLESTRITARSANEPDATSPAAEE